MTKNNKQKRKSPGLLQAQRLLKPVGHWVGSLAFCQEWQCPEQGEKPHPNAGIIKTQFINKKKKRKNIGEKHEYKTHNTAKQIGNINQHRQKKGGSMKLDAMWWK